ncbi:twin-arginine translocation signal domain-containing protein [Streptomyces malaysiensis]|nr:twin-arginine translocation signal domain-containing protein [Streptomyces malaysiensis]
MPPIPRRNLLKAAAVTGAAAPFSWLLAIPATGRSG